MLDESHRWFLSKPATIKVCASKRGHAHPGTFFFSPASTHLSRRSNRRPSSRRRRRSRSGRQLLVAAALPVAVVAVIVVARLRLRLRLFDVFGLSLGRPSVAGLKT